MVLTDVKPCALNSMLGGKEGPKSSCKRGRSALLLELSCTLHATVRVSSHSVCGAARGWVAARPAAPPFGSRV